MDNFDNYNIKTGNLNVFYSQQKDGNMSIKFGDEDTVHKNRKRYYQSLGIDISKTVYMHTEISDVICEFINKAPESDIWCDAVITNMTDYYFYLAFGDCIPLVYFDIEKKIMGFGHLGWQSICKNLHIKLLHQLIRDHQCEIDDLILVIGPSIKAKSYIFSDPAQLYMDGWEDFLFKQNGLYHVDLVGYIQRDIIKERFLDTNIFISEIDTGSNNEYYSHYRSVHDDKYIEGRFIFGAGIVD